MSSEQTALEKKAQVGGALVEIEQARVIQEVQGAIVMARKYPRDEDVSMAKILKACQRPALAYAATYAFPRGDATVTGPSIRLAEMLAQCWGNIQHGVRELSRGAAESTAQAVAWDLETNTRAEKVFQVPHIRETKKGNYRLTDGRDIYETVANQGARRLRACILAIIPGDVVDAAVAACEKTLDAKSAPLSDRIKSMVDAFGELGVTVQAIEAKLRHPIGATTAAEVKSMGRVLLTIQDGMASVSDYFAPKTAPVQSVKEAVAKKAEEARKPGIVDRLRGRANPQSGDIEEPPTGEGQNEIW